MLFYYGSPSELILSGIGDGGGGVEERGGKKERGEKWTSVLLSPGATTGLKKKKTHQRLPDGPVIKTSPFNAEGAGLIPGRGAKIPHGLLAKKKTKHKTKAVL